MTRSQKRSESVESKKTAAIYRRANYVSERKVGETTYLVDKRRNTIHQLNLVGAAIWHQLDDPKSIGELVRMLHIVFGITKYSVIKQDVEDLIGALLKAELIVRSSTKDDDPDPNAQH